MTRRVARDEVGADSGTPQEGALVEAEAIRQGLGGDFSFAGIGPSEEKERVANAALDSLLAYIKQLEALQEGYYVDAQQARAQVKQLEGERDAQISITAGWQNRTLTAERENERQGRVIEDVREAVNDLYNAGSEPAVLKVIESALVARTEEPR